MEIKDEAKTKEQLLAELADLRLRAESLRHEISDLKAGEERYRNFVENAADSFAEFDLVGLCTFCNQSAYALVGCTHEEYLQRRHRDRFSSQEEADRVLAAFGEIYQTGRAADLVIANLLCKDGTTRAIESSISLIKDLNGRPTGFRSIGRDLTERKRIEHERERYCTFVDNINEGCFEFDLDGNITFCNEAMAGMFGCSRDELMRMDRLARYASPEDARRVFRMYSEILEEDLSSKILEYQIMGCDGVARDLEASVSLIRDGSGKPSGYRGIGRDVTERKKMEREKERYREFVENVGDICAEYDLHGVCTFCNEAAVRVLGYSREELLNRRHSERYASKEEGDRVFTAVHETFCKRLPVNYVISNVVCKNGAVKCLESAISLNFDDGGQPVGFRSIARDVSERSKMEKDLARYRDFMESVEDSCAEFDMRGRCIFCNEAAHRMLGYTRREFMQLRHHQRYASPEEVREVFDLFNELWRTGQPAKMYTVNLRCKDGTTKSAESIVSLIRDGQGNPVGFRNVARDVTKRNSMEVQQVRLREQLNQARKMEAIGTLAGGVAHDFNNLLMGIQGYTSLMLLDTDSRHPHHTKLKAIESHVKSGADLTRQLLGYARGGRYEVKPLDLNAVVRKSADMFGRTKKEISMAMHLAENLWSIDADSGQMEQVLLNLFVNAWQAMPGGGDIFIRSQNVVLETSHARSLNVQPGPYVKLTIKDTGVGMDAVTRERLFEPFFTTKEMGMVRGTGLGLASAYGIVTGHQGAINVQSETGQGATFNIYLPASFREVQNQIEPEAVPVSGKEAILLVDDEKGILDVVGKMIEGLGYAVLTAESGEEAVELYRSDPDAIDLVIMDMIMPGRGGGEAIDAILAIHPAARIILSSGYSLDGEAQKILDRAGSVTFLQKPFQLSDLSLNIRARLDQ
ncbi:MAG: PAS domain S-box protein [Smithellaceae bacterium]